MRLDATQRHTVLAHPAGWIASGFGAGLSPVAAGTVGSAVALLPWLGLRELPPAVCVLLIVAAFGIGVWASGVVVARLRIDDPGVIVWDEFVGQWIALLPLLWVPRGWPWILVAFGLFRLFDIAKPWPVSWADRSLGGGFGVMFDDVLAGLYAATLLVVVLHFA